MKGIVLAGGAGTRLYPASIPISKILLPVYDKPMIYYPISILMLAGIKDILIISNPKDIDNFKKLLGTGSQLGVNFSYAIQSVPKGIADSFIIAEDFIGNDSVALILGDNIFHGQGFSGALKKIKEENIGATVFGYHVKDPERFGVVEFDKEGKALSLEEKPQKPKSKYAVTGLYFYDNNVIKYAKSLKPSARGELEITDLNKIYLEKGELNVKILTRGFAWLDTGTHESLLKASNFIQSMEENKGEIFAC
jgi:glucose-1-phosphate thymidylyltransferase